MEAFENIKRTQMRQRELERRMEHIEILKAIYSPPQIMIIPLEILEKGKQYLQENKLYISEQDVYKWLFLNNVVNETTVQFAINHAINKVHKFIDNYK